MLPSSILSDANQQHINEWAKLFGILPTEVLNYAVSNFFHDRGLLVMERKRQLLVEAGASVIPFPTKTKTEPRTHVRRAAAV